jgi:DNA invertase Pin-like site-specific DNA recombinase
MRIGYTLEDRKEEMEQLTLSNCDEILIEKQSHPLKFAKIQWNQLMERLSEEDTLVLVDLTCLGRTISEMLRYFIEIPCNVELLNEELEMETLKKVAPVLIEMEKHAMKQRSQQGMEKSQKKPGKPKVWNDPHFREKFWYYVKEDMNVKEVCRVLGISRATFYRLLHWVTEEQKEQMEKEKLLEQVNTIEETLLKK